MSLFGKSKPKLDLAPGFPEGPDTLAADGKLTEREVAYLAKLAAAGIDVRAPRPVTFLFVYRNRAETADVIRRFEGPQFVGTVVPGERGAGDGAFTLASDAFALDPELAQWAREFRSVDTDDVSYVGWVANFPEVSTRAAETFLRGF